MHPHRTWLFLPLVAISVRPEARNWKLFPSAVHMTRRQAHCLALENLDAIFSRQVPDGVVIIRVHALHTFEKLAEMPGKDGDRQTRGHVRDIAERVRNIARTDRRRTRRARHG